MELATKENSDSKAGLDGVSKAALGFATVVGLLFPPFALLVLFSCVLEMLIRAGRGETPVIENDRDFYRRVVRPIGRFLVWGPVAAFIVILLFGVVFTFGYFVLSSSSQFLGL
jgi:hypothetical protein